MKALVSGITGFIGSHVAERLLREGHEVIGVARHSWHADAPGGLPQHVELVSWNIEHPAEDGVLQRLRRFAPDVIFHFAGLSIPSQCGQVAPTAQALAVNVAGTSHMLRLAHALPARRMIFASTCHVYDHVDAATAVVSEDLPLRPISAYGTTKLLCEQALWQEQVQSGLEICIVRGFHHIGPRQPPGLMLTDWLAQLLPGSAEIHVRSTHSYLDLVDVRDAAAAYCLLAETRPCVPVCNLGSGRVARSGEVLEALLRNIDRPIRVIVTSDKEQWNPIANISVLQSLGWNPETSYQETISDMLSCRTVT